jgi:hypothetical protein
VLQFPCTVCPVLERGSVQFSFLVAVKLASQSSDRSALVVSAQDDSQPVVQSSDLAANFPDLMMQS